MKIRYLKELIFFGFEIFIKFDYSFLHKSFLGFGSVASFLLPHYLIFKGLHLVCEELNFFSIIFTSSVYLSSILPGFFLGPIFSFETKLQKLLLIKIKLYQN